MNLIPRSFFFDDDFENLFLTAPRRNDLKCDIYEKDNNYHIEMDIPGFAKEDITVDIKDKYLTVKASKSKEQEEDTKNYIRKERSYGEYTRSFYLGNVDEENVDAKFEKGTLLITIPKKEENDLRKNIEIK